MHKTKNLIYLFFFICAMTFGVACKKQLDTNLTDTNGHGVNVLTGKDIFSQALLGTVSNKIGSNINLSPVDNYDHATQWMQYWARTTAFAPSGSQAQMETFTLSNSYSDGIWQSLYHNIYDYNFIIVKSSENSILAGAARVMRAMIFQDLVDHFGNVPYYQACQPNSTIQPQYDSAEVIYKDLIPQLDTAIAAIQASQTTPDDASDIMFHGSKNLWTEFANTIKLRILLRQVPNGDVGYATTEINKIAQQGFGFLGAGEDALINPGFFDATTKQSVFWATYGVQPNGGSPYQNNVFFIANTFMLDYLDSTADPRLGYCYAMNSDGGYGGNQFGNSVTPESEISSIGPGILQSPSMPALLFSASQSYFMQAEAVQRGLLTGDLKTLFTHGVEESFRYLTIPNYVAAADSFVNNSTSEAVNLAISTNPLKTILYQKWVAECELDGYESYSDYRRTGYPVIPTPSFSVPDAAIPKRLLYPESEYTQNPQNVNAQNQQPGDIYKKIFWGL